jgi:hypothetical protein
MEVASKGRQVRRWLWPVVAAGLTWAWATPTAMARSPEDCQLSWGQAVRSYQSASRGKGPEDPAFKAACELTLSGKKDEGRLEAVVVAIRALAELDPKGCVRFAQSYVRMRDPQGVCDAGTGEEEALRKLVAEGLPPPPWNKGK